MNADILVQLTGIEMKCPFDVIFVENRYQSAVFQFSVIVAHCQHFVLSPRKADIWFHTRCLLVFVCNNAKNPEIHENCAFRDN
jgi:hypothetical protein